jgi:hypothetical protein
MENKQKICDLLLETLRATRECSDLESLTYITPEQPSRYDSYVEVKFQGGGGGIVNTSMDSGFAMIRDIMAHI